jgi:ubiquinone/menaquinone biosynthesis C-methylase UbiE
LEIKRKSGEVNMQNIFDNDIFYVNYISLRENKRGLNEVLEMPAFRALLPDLHDETILDLGCGFGENCQWYIAKGAKKVIGIDISEKMIRKAKDFYHDSKIEYINLPMEKIDFPNHYFDSVFSSLAFHYVDDFDSLLKKISHVLKPEGKLVFSQEHPIATAKMVSDGWVKNECGEKLHWIMDDYDFEGKRKQTWFVEGVVKYHRKLSSIVNMLIDNGFKIARIIEPVAIEAAEKLNEKLKEERRRPPFLLIKATKI